MNDDEYITCEELIEFLGDYLAEELATAQRAEFDRHLAVCPSCVAYLEGYARTVKLSREAAAGAAAIAPEGLIAAITAARRRGA